MNLNDFDFILPQELIAQNPLPERTASRLLCLNSNNGKITHKHFVDLPELLLPNDLLIFNNTKVIPARLFGVKATGGKVEILVERIIDSRTFIAQIRASKTPKIGSKIILAEDVGLEVCGRRDDFFEVVLYGANDNDNDILSVLEKIGHVPLPPYIKHQDTNIDKQRYQTVFAKHHGAVAAPTAGLHFDKNLLQKLADKGVQQAFVTLHVGAGTFQPIRVERIEQHRMHSEYFEISEHTCEQIENAKRCGGRVVAVGTTTVRVLESAAKMFNGAIKPYSGYTDIFIYPGYKFHAIDALITNFHLPKSTLLMLVCAFAGYDNVMRTYHEAIKLQYRFFSYGDGMLIVNE